MAKYAGEYLVVPKPFVWDMFGPMVSQALQSNQAKTPSNTKIGMRSGLSFTALSSKRMDRLMGAITRFEQQSADGTVCLQERCADR